MLTVKAKLKSTLQEIYKRRFDKTEGLDAWVAATIAKPFPNPQTPSSRCRSGAGKAGDHDDDHNDAVGTAKARAACRKAADNDDKAYGITCRKTRDRHKTAGDG